LPRIIVASYIAYICCEFTNSTIIAKMKVWSKGDNFPLRAAASTIVAQLVDSAIFFTAAFAGTVPDGVLLSLVLSTWGAKSLYEILALPFTTWAVTWLKKREGVEHFDRQRLEIFRF
jgi:uncharacterized integral membrane protein (TIGR00697 family)